MTKWIMCLAAITSLNLVAAPSKQEAAIIAEFNQSIKAELKQEIKSQASKANKKQVQTSKASVNSKNDTVKFIANVHYSTEQRTQ